MLWKRLSVCLLAAACLLSYSPAALAAEGNGSPDLETQPLAVVEAAPEETETVPSEDETENVDETIPYFPTVCDEVGDLLETQQHDAYIQGYKGAFRPNGKITRAETAQMFYSLLKDKPQSPEFSFEDVPEGQWYTEPVRALASLGAINGYPSGLFCPGRSISRAEFVTIAARFSKLLSSETTFPDLDTAEWAISSITSAVAHGWIKGYPDGTFRPNSPISRAEAVVILNAMLERTADKNAVRISQTTEFSDVERTYWAYAQISEAATSHDYARTDDGELWEFPDRYSGAAWVADESGFSYQPTEGAPLTGFQHIGEYTYYFDETGLLQTGWQVIDGKHYLLPEKNQEEHSLQISELLTKVNFRAAQRGFDDIDYITVHYTAEPGVSAHTECLSFEDRYRAASAHFFVDSDGIWRCVMDRDISWHCGNDVYYHDVCRNGNSIGIEMCCEKVDAAHAESPYDDDWYFREGTMENTARLVRELMMRYGIPLENVVRHNDISHKTCPAPFVNDFSAWQGFLDRVGEYRVDYDGSYPARVTHAAVNVRTGPGAGYPAVTTLKRGETVTVLEEYGKDNDPDGRWVRIDKGWIYYEYISRK